MKKIFTQNELPEIVAQLLQQAGSKQGNTATIVALSGELGAGKTTLTQEVARTLSIKENIISPTFVIFKKYPIKNKTYRWKNLIHIDAYRLDSSAELFKLGWEELTVDSENLIILEWPERVPECLTGDIVQVKLSYIDEKTRQIEIML
jgi:tRNA threonylcarbamoyladenosine biosynthesis protein TsaE